MRTAMVESCETYLKPIGVKVMIKIAAEQNVAIARNNISFENNSFDIT